MMEYLHAVARTHRVHPRPERGFRSRPRTNRPESRTDVTEKREMLVTDLSKRRPEEHDGVRDLRAKRRFVICILCHPINSRP